MCKRGSSWSFSYTPVLCCVFSFLVLYSEAILCLGLQSQARWVGFGSPVLPKTDREEHSEDKGTSYLHRTHSEGSCFSLALICF